MEIFETHKDLPEASKGAVVVIGNFDGVHLGHQSLLEKAKDIAKTNGLKLAVLTFEPHPRVILRPDDPPDRITPYKLKAQKLQEYGVQILYSVNFNWDLASISAADFIQDILINGIGAKHVVVGADFKFGQMRTGNPQMIEDAGIGVTVLDKKLCSGEQTISASRIRLLIRHGKIDIANELLGWDWEFSGEVVHGDKRGREIGFPTANVHIDGIVHPSYGVYAGKVMLQGEDAWRICAMNIGIRPMFAVEKAQAEAHILDWNGDIYGQKLRIKPIKRLRGEARFDGIDELVKQIGKDCAETVKVLS